MTHPRRILFTNWIDRTNYNAQSLNVREIALRLDPARFHSTLFYESDPDPRLRGHPNIRLVKIPARFGTATMLAQALRGQDVWFRVNLIRMTELYLQLPRALRGHARLIDWLEGPPDQFDSDAERAAFVRIQAQVPYRVSMTEYVAEKHWENYHLTTDAIIPVGVDTAHFAPPPQPRAHARPVVLFVGHFIQRKYPHAVLLAARRFPQADFLLVGAARDAFGPRLFQLKEKWHLDNVTFHAPVGHDALLGIMQAADIIMHPGKLESIVKVILEGGATGLPGLLFDEFRSPATVNGVTGFQVKTFDEMLEKLGLLLENPALRTQMGTAAIAHAKKFDWQVITQAWERFLDEQVP